MGETVDKKDYYIVEGSIGMISFWLSDYDSSSDVICDAVRFRKDITAAIEIPVKDLKGVIEVCKGVLPFVSFVSRHMRRIITTKIEVEVKEITHDIT